MGPATLFDALPDPLVTLGRQSRLIYANAAARSSSLPPTDSCP